MSVVTITIDFDDGSGVNASVRGENLTNNLQAALQSVMSAANARNGVPQAPPPEQAEAKQPQDRKPPAKRAARKRTTASK